MKLLYKPVAIICGIVAGKIATVLFGKIWDRIDGDPPPEPHERRASAGKVVAAAALEGLTFSATRAAVDRVGAQTFANVTGVWPEGKEKKKKKQDEAAAGSLSSY